MTHGQDPLSDIPPFTWIDRWLPRASLPYARLARLDRPIGTWLLLLPGWWAMTLADFGRPHLQLGLLFLVGAIVMRGAGCTYNDIVDRDIDAKVARTRGRPLPSGQVTLRAAWMFLGAQLLIGLAVLIQLNRYAIGVGLCSLVLVFTYPFMKRITFWPQAWLGLTFNWGVLAGWAAARGRMDRPALLLYAAGFFWTLGYDTIYAHQDKEDDALAGVKSSALALGAATRPAVAVFYIATMALIVMALEPFAPGRATRLALIAASGHLLWQVSTLKIDDPANCLARFRSNRDFGFLILAAMALTQV
jgi:4-hydroxybenzoate polyprenyltransferase